MDLPSGALGDEKTVFGGGNRVFATSNTYSGVSVALCSFRRDALISASHRVLPRPAQCWHTLCSFTEVRSGCNMWCRGDDTGEVLTTDRRRSHPQFSVITKPLGTSGRALYLPPAGRHSGRRTRAARGIPPGSFSGRRDCHDRTAYPRSDGF
jgi:hypothetical protein